MGLQVVGAGLPRTGTKSLRCALETLLGGPCYHMHEVFDNLDHVPFWRRAVAGQRSEWPGVLAGYVATVDWPGSAFWGELSEANPDAVVLLSRRQSADAWWRSIDGSILGAARTEQPPEQVEWGRLFRELLSRLTPDWNDPHAMMAAYERHNDEVRSAVPADRLLEWTPEDGWRHLCRGLGRPVPSEPFPHL